MRRDKSRPPLESLREVVAIFGSNDDGKPELWLAIKLSSTRNKIRVQYLEEASGEPAMYILLQQTGMHDPEEIEKSFAGIPFIDTRRGKTISTRLKSPFDAALIASLKAACAKRLD